MITNKESDLLQKTTTFLAHAAWSAAGKDFFEELAIFLAETLDVEYICIDRLLGDGHTAMTVANYLNGNFEDNISYALKDTPCGEVVGKTICCFPEKVRHLFPNDQVLQEMAAESYAGATLWSFNGKPIGLIAAIGLKPMKNPQLAESILNLVGVRASGELERREMLEAFRLTQFVVDNMTDSTIWTKEDGSIYYVNKAACIQRGYSREEMLKLKIWDIVTGFSAEKWKAHWERLKYAGNLEYENIHNTRSGDLFPVEVHTNYIIVDGTEYACAIVRDISRRKEMEEAILKSQEKFAKAFQNSPDIIIITTLETGNIVEVNNSIQRYGWNKDEIMGKSTVGLGFWANPDDRKNLVELLKQQGSVYNFETSFNRNKGEPFFALVSSEILELSGNTYVLTNVHDIDEIKKTETTLRENELRLTELNATKDRFFSLIAHDLKSPFNSIIGFSELLLEQIRDNEQEGIEKFATVIYQSANRAVDLLVNLLDWSRTQTGLIKFNPEFFEMNSMVREVVELIGPTASQKSISVKNHLPSYMVVNADKGMIHTVLRNLLSNAVKFTRPQGAIVVTGMEKNGMVSISVKDNGIGIPKNSLAKLFRIDQNYTSPGTGNEKGSGLGLIICKEFIEKHGGSISVISEEGSGSEFTFRIPVN